MVVLWIPTAKWGKSARKPSALRVVGDDGNADESFAIPIPWWTTLFDVNVGRCVGCGSVNGFGPGSGCTSSIKVRP